MKKLLLLSSFLFCIKLFAVQEIKLQTFQKTPRNMALLIKKHYKKARYFIYLGTQNKYYGELKRKKSKTFFIQTKDTLFIFTKKEFKPVKIIKQPFQKSDLSKYSIKNEYQQNYSNELALNIRKKIERTLTIENKTTMDESYLYIHASYQISKSKYLLLVQSSAKSRYRYLTYNLKKPLELGLKYYSKAFGVGYFKGGVSNLKRIFKNSIYHRKTQKAYFIGLGKESYPSLFEFDFKRNKKRIFLENALNIKRLWVLQKSPYICIEIDIINKNTKKPETILLFFSIAPTYGFLQIKHFKNTYE